MIGASGRSARGGVIRCKAAKGRHKMWEEATTVIDRAGVPEKRKTLARQVISYFSVPPKGVAIVLDGGDYQEHPTWRNRAVHLNLKLGYVGQDSPGHLAELAESRNYSNLVWLSRRVSLGTDVNFTWTLAHELRHLERSLENLALSLAGTFLFHTLGHIATEEPKVDLTVPTELDAELAAWRVTRKIFGMKAADGHVHNQVASRRIRLLLTFDPEKPYDARGETVALLRKYQSQLEAYQQQSDDDYTRGFDINEICSNLI